MVAADRHTVPVCLVRTKRRSTESLNEPKDYSPPRRELRMTMPFSMATGIFGVTFKF